MLHKTEGIVFKHFKYGDTSIIVKIFTREFGLQSYIVNGARSKKSKGKIALYQPLTLLDMVVYKKSGGGISRISETRCHKALKTIPYEIIKSTIGVFLSEVLYKCIKEDEPDFKLFDFITQSILIFDELESGFQNFHLLFMIKLTQFLGFGISSSAEVAPIHDVKVSAKMEMLMNADYGSQLVLSTKERRELLDLLLAFYRTHIETCGELKSVKVLRSVLS